MRLLHGYLTHERALGCGAKIATQAQSEMGKEQKTTASSTLRAIQDELAKLPEKPPSIPAPAARGSGLAGGSPARRNVASCRLEQTPAASPDYQLTRTYLELIAELLAQELASSIDLKRARQVLDEDHFGLEEVKERILEHLAVLEAESGRTPRSFAWSDRPARQDLPGSIRGPGAGAFELHEPGGMHDEARAARPSPH